MLSLILDLHKSEKRQPYAHQQGNDPFQQIPVNRRPSAPTQLQSSQNQRTNMVSRDSFLKISR